MPHFKKLLHNSVQYQDRSIQSYTVGEKKIWLKKASKRHSTWIYIPLQWLANFCQLKALTPIPNYGGQRAIRCEVQRLQQLCALGVTVPKLLVASDLGLIIEDAACHGETVLQLDQKLALLHNDPAAKLKLFHATIQAILAIHNKQSYLSEAFARNILVNEQHQFTFIDFETDPGQVLDLNTCHIRDWLCLIFSTAQFFDEQALLLHACQCFQQTISPSSAAYIGILQVAHKFRWASQIKFEKIGSDGLRIQKCFAFLKQLTLQKNDTHL